MHGQNHIKSLFFEFQQLPDCSFSNVCTPYQRNRTPAGKKPM